MYEILKIKTQPNKGGQIMLKKIITTILVLTMLISVIPVNAAEDEIVLSEGLLYTLEWSVADELERELITDMIKQFLASLKSRTPEREDEIDRALRYFLGIQSNTPDTKVTKEMVKEKLDSWYWIDEYFSSSVDSPSSWAKEEVFAARVHGIIPERLQTNYQKPITREEFCELVIQSLFAGITKITPQDILDRIESPTFTDCSAPHVKVAYIIGIVNGTTDTTFEPNKTITRQEAAIMLANKEQMSGQSMFYGFAKEKYKDYKDISDWAIDAVDICYQAEIMKGTGEKFEPKSSYTREQAILTIYRSWSPITSSPMGLRGIVYISAGEFKTNNTNTYKVGKDYVYVNYPEEHYLTALQEWSWGGINRAYNLGIDTPSYAQFSLVYFHGMALIGASKNMVEEGVYKKFDYGYMIVEAWTEDYLLKFTFKPNIGYVSCTGSGIFYTRDKIKSIITEIE
jgi:hypothetical protein